MRMNFFLRFWFFSICLAALQGSQAHSAPLQLTQWRLAAGPSLAPFDASQALEVYLQDEQGQIIEPLPPQLESRLNAALRLEEEKYIERTSRGWGFQIRAARPARPEHAALAPAFSQEFLLCLRLLPNRQRETIKRVLYDLSAAISLAGTPQISAEATAAVRLMRDNYRLHRCREGAEGLPEFTERLVSEYIRVLLGGADLSTALATGDGENFAVVFEELLFGEQGIWQQVARDALAEAIKTRLTGLARPLELSWMEERYAGFVDFVLSSRRASGLQREDYIALVKACRLEEIAQVFASFALATCAAEGNLQVIQIQGESEPLALLVLDWREGEVLP